MNKTKLLGLIGMSSITGSLIGIKLLKSNNWIVISTLSSLGSIITIKYCLTGKLL